MQAIISRGKNSPEARLRWESRIPGINLVPQALAKTKGRILMIGKVISHYRTLEELGRGGMGVVYKAEDTKLKRLVALKFLHQEFTQDSEAKERFIREARAASALDHPNICTIHEIDETKDGQMFICMAYYDAETLKQKIEHGPLSVEQAIDIILQICRGLAKAHQQGLIHRDIKPANILITKDGIVKIVDFGLAKLEGQTRITKEKSTMGTVAYLSPEQAKGNEVDQQTDIWSLGVILYEMCTNKLPFDQEYDAAIIYAIINKSPTPPTDIQQDIPKKLENCIFKCLRKAKEERYTSTSDLIVALKHIQSELKKDLKTDKKNKGYHKRETEKRTVIIVVAEISGYHEMLHILDEEETALIMNECFEFFRKATETHKGILKKISVNNYMVLFGIPSASEDPSKHAMNLSIELRNRLGQLNKDKRLPVPLSLKVGIHSGKIIVDEIWIDDQKEYSVIGDAVNVVLKLKDLAKIGQVYVSGPIHKFTKNEFEFKKVEPLIIKEDNKQLSIYELLSVKEKIYRAGFESKRMIFSEIIGREKELDKLQLHLLKLINGEGSIVNVIGEAGIGKSRLIAELCKKDEINRVTLLEGRALSIGKNLAFHLIIDILKKFAGIDEEDDEAASFYKIEKMIRKIHPEAIQEILPFIATLMGIRLSGKHAERIQGIEGDALEKLILKNLREFVGKSSEIKPLIFIIEDLHWADLSSIEMLESLYRLVENHSILFINVFRPGYEKTSDRILSTIKDRYIHYHEEIYIEPLSEQQSEILTNNLLRIKILPPKFSALLFERTEGNPFFIEEVVRSLIDEAIVIFENGEFKVSQKIETVMIPGTINEVLMSRIDKLDENTRTLLKTASVIGRYFFYKILVDVAHEIDEIDEQLTYLKEIQLVLKRQRMAEVEFLFKHALVQQVVYDTLTDKQKKQSHLRIAQAIERIFQDRLPEFYGTLAYHYSIAEELDRAEKYLILAGEKALKTSASSEAIHYYKQALAIYRKKYGTSADMKKIAMLEKYIGTALLYKGHFIEAVEYFERVLSYHGMNCPASIVPSALKFIYGFFVLIMKVYFPALMGNKMPSDEELEISALIKSKSWALSITDAKRFVIELISYSPWYTRFDIRKVDILAMTQGAFSYGGISQAISDKMVEYYGKRYDKNDSKALFEFICGRNMGNLLKGNWKEEQFNENIVNQHLLFLDDMAYIVTYVACMAHIYCERGDQKAKQTLEKLSEISETYENDYGRLASFTHGSLYLLKYRKLHQSLEKADAGIRFVQKSLGNKPGLLILYSIKIKVQILLDDISGAEATLKTAEEYVSTDTFVPYFLSYYLTSRFCYLLYQLEDHFKSGNKHQLEKMRKCCLKSGKRAVKISRKVAYERCENYRMMGIYYWLTGKTKKALKWWEKSIREAEDLGARLELSRTYMEVGKRLLEDKSKTNRFNGIDAETYLNKAGELFADMDLKWDIEKLEKINRNLKN
jgi:serine/threonine protein kinase/tetratricopeptide (TPR) repeat protein